MRIPERLAPLVDQGIIEEVIRPLMSGKEAQVYLVRSEGEVRVAKLYKELDHRSFRNRSDYTDGRRVRNSREARAIAKRSAYGRSLDEAAWHNAEVDALFRIHAVGVRVPQPYEFVDGVLVMELVQDHEGQPAPRLADISLDKREAKAIFQHLLREVVRMLCGGIVHADLSDFNVLMAYDGPVLIDFPQCVDPAHNNNAQRLLIRDVDNLTRILGRFAPELRRMRYGHEIWDLYERGELRPDSALTGKRRRKAKADTSGLLAEIEELERESRERREALGLPPAAPPRAPISLLEPEPEPVPAEPEPAKAPSANKRKRNRRRRRSGGGDSSQAQAQSQTQSQGAPSAKRRRNRRRRRGPKGENS
jgi:RIO kinase 1